MRQRAALRRGSDRGKKSVLADRPLKFGKRALSDKNSYLRNVLSLLQNTNHVGALTIYGVLVALGVSHPTSLRENHKEVQLLEKTSLKLTHFK